MKRSGIIIGLLFTLGVYAFYSCKKTSSASSSSSTTTTAVASPSVNTSITIGGAGWYFDGCGSSPTLTAIYGTSTVELVFGSPKPIISGVYALTQGVPTSGQARLKILDPPGQPSGFQWYAQGSQAISVTTTTMNYSIATFSNITCTQTSTSTPVVTATGTMGCI